jgi:hypothetical protein
MDPILVEIRKVAYREAYRILEDVDHAKSVANRTAALAAKRLEANPCYFRMKYSHVCWAKLTACREAWHIAKKERQEPSSGSEATEIAVSAAPSRERRPEALAEENALRKLVRAALYELEPEERWVLWAGFSEKLTLKEIAAVLGVAGPPAAMRRRDAAIEKLHGALLCHGVSWDEAREAPDVLLEELDRAVACDRDRGLVPKIDDCNPEE